ncbi:hypothetical protein KEM56_001119 [Ascosphaera pollenicola]|nr:hypothetical protein KEM56_001119 [Ascosphaera pollenicola]
MASIATPLRRSARLRESKGYFATPTQAVQSPAPGFPATKEDNTTDATEKTAKTPFKTPTAERIVDSTFITPFKKENQPTEDTPDNESTTPMAKPAFTKILTRTPEVGSRTFKPGLEEMHPSKVQQSTTKTVDSGLVLGFKPIPKTSEDKANTSTPSRSRITQAESNDSPNYPLLKTPTKEHAELSEEARKLMETIRKDAARIEAELAIERAKERENRMNEEAERAAVARKMATPIGPSGRFSDAHSAQFKKMDSIANHPSSHRPILPPVISSSPRKALKRSISKARLDEDETRAATPSKSKKAHIAKLSTEDAPSKDDSKQGFKSKVQEAPATPRRRSIIPRATTVYHPKVTKPLSPSASKQTAPRTPQTEFNPKFKTQIPELKSILRKRQPLFSTDPAKIAAGTHVPPPAVVSTTHDWDQKLYGLDDDNAAPAPSPSKRVVFSPSTKRNSTMRLREAIDESSPTRSKTAGTDAEIQETRDSAVPASVQLPSTVRYPTLPPATPSPVSANKHSGIYKFGSSTVPSPKSPSIRASTVKTKQQHPVKSKPVPTISPAPKSPLTQRTPGQWPEMIPHGISNKKRHRDQVDDGEGNEENKPPVEEVKEEDGTVKERTKKRVKMTKEPSFNFTSKAEPAKADASHDPKKVKHFTANKASTTGPSSRGTAMAGTASSAARSSTTTSTGQKIVPHTPASKRFRPGGQPRTMASTRHVTPAVRRAAAAGTSTTGKKAPAAPSAVRRAGGGGNGGNGISMSRLAALAQPKKR